MADDGVGVFCRFHEAWTSGNLSTVLALVDPEIVARPLHRILFTRSEFRGAEGIEEWYREMTEPWDRFEAVVEEARATPTGAVGLLRVATAATTGSTPASGSPARCVTDASPRSSRATRATSRRRSGGDRRHLGSPGLVAGV